MNEREKLLALAVIDAGLTDYYRKDLFTDEQREKAVDKLLAVIGDEDKFREGLIELGRKLYAELFEGEAVE